MSLKHRVCTAGILLPMVIGVVLLESIPLFAVLMFALLLVCAREWARLCGFLARGCFLYAGGVSILLLALTPFSAPEWLIFLPQFLLPQIIGDSITSAHYFVIWFALLWWLYALFSVICHQQGWRYFRPVRYWGLCMGICALVPAWLAVCILYGKFAHGAVLLMYLLVLIWSADAAAYFVGRYFGRLKLVNVVSPGKTWAGVYGAISSAVMVAGIVIFIYYKLPPEAIALPDNMHEPYLWLVLSSAAESAQQSFVAGTNGAILYISPLAFMGLSVLTVAAAILGDLYESLLKRLAGNKDSGSLLPGHGGFLDRLDSLTAAAPVFLFAVLFYLD